MSAASLKPEAGQKFCSSLRPPKLCGAKAGAENRRLPTPAPFPAKPALIGLVERDYKGYDILTFRSTFWGVARSLGDIDLEQIPVERLNQLRAEGKCFIEQFTDEVKERIDRVPHP